MLRFQCCRIFVYVDDFCWLMSEADWWIKISLQPSWTSRWYKRNTMLHNRVKLRQYTTKNRCFLANFLCVVDLQISLGGYLTENKTWCSRMLVRCLFFYFLSVKPLSGDCFLSIPCNPLPLGSEESIFQSVLFPLLWPVCPRPCLNVWSSLFLDSLLRNTELTTGLLSSSWYLFHFFLFFCICIRNVLPSVCSC